MRRVGVNDVFGTSGEPAELMTYFGLDADSIVRAARELLG
jgi:transketolase